MPTLILKVLLILNDFKLHEDFTDTNFYEHILCFQTRDFNYFCSVRFCFSLKRIQFKICFDLNQILISILKHFVSAGMVSPSYCGRSKGLVKSTAIGTTSTTVCCKLLTQIRIFYGWHTLNICQLYFRFRLIFSQIVHSTLYQNN